jgi:hypothetical protein
MEGATMEKQWSADALRTQQPDTVPVLIEGRVVEAKIRKFDDQPETTIQIGEEYFGTTWQAILEALNAGKPLEIIPDAEKPQE